MSIVDGTPAGVDAILGAGDVFEGILWATGLPSLTPPADPVGNLAYLPGCGPVPQGHLYAITVQRSGDGPLVLDWVEELPGDVDPAVVMAALGVLP